MVVEAGMARCHGQMTGRRGSRPRRTRFFRGELAAEEPCTPNGLERESHPASVSRCRSPCNMPIRFGKRQTVMRWPSRQLPLSARGPAALPRGSRFEILPRTGFSIEPEKWRPCACPLYPAAPIPHVLIPDVTPNPLTQGGRYRISMGFTRDATTPSVTIEVDSQEPLVGQTVTVTASTSSAFGSAS